MVEIFGRSNVLSVLFTPTVVFYLAENTLCRNTFNSRLSLCFAKCTKVVRKVKNVLPYKGIY